MAVQWIHDFIKLSRRQMLPFTSGILVKTKDLQQHTILGGYGILIVVISMNKLTTYASYSVIPEKNKFGGGC
jgi:hypothetical protein